MTKTQAGLAVLGLLTIATSNATNLVSCVNSPPTNSATATGNGQDPTFSGSVFTCTIPTLPVGNALSSVDVIIDDDYSLGTSSSNNEVEFSYSMSSFTGASTLTTTVLGLGGTPPFGVSSTAGGIVGQSGVPTCSADSTNAFDCEEPGGSLSTPGGSFTVTGSSIWISGSLQQGGSDQFSVSFSYTYAPVTTTPEPATLFLLGGGGLLGLALVARRRLKA
jgi:hypothetical protein